MRGCCWLVSFDEENCYYWPGRDIHLLNINKIRRFRFYRLEGVESFADCCVLISNFCDFCEVAPPTWVQLGLCINFLFLSHDTWENGRRQEAVFLPCMSSFFTMHEQFLSSNFPFYKISRVSVEFPSNLQQNI
jgi:hypothetical protein